MAKEFSYKDFFEFFGYFYGWIPEESYPVPDLQNVSHLIKLYFTAEAAAETGMKITLCRSERVRRCRESVPPAGASEAFLSK